MSDSSINKIILQEKPSGRRLFLHCLLALSALLALRLHWSVGAGLETGNFLIDNFSKLANCFYFGGFEDVLIFAALVLAMEYLSRVGEKPDWPSIILAAVFSLLYVTAKVCQHMGNFSFFFANLFQLCLSVFCLFGYTALFYPMIRLIFHLMEKDSPREETNLRHPVRNGALIIFVGWLPWMLMNYPGTISPDAMSQLNQWLGNIPWSAHHPPFSSLIMGFWLSLGELLADRNFGVFLYLVFQAIIASFIFAYSITLLWRMGLSRRFYIASLVFFAASPFWGCFAQFYEKDLFYALAFALTLCLLLPVLKKRECSWADALRIGAACFAAILLRKTGTYELLPALFLAVLLLKKTDRTRMLAATCAVFILSSCVSNVLYPALNIEGGSIKEMLSIPFQQTARYVNDFPDEVTDSERQAIDAVLVYDELDKYDPRISDAVKNNYRGDGAALPEYFKAWFGMLLKHPVCYFEAGFMKCYATLAPVEPLLDAYILSQYHPGTDELGIHRVFGDFPTRLFDSFRQIFIQFPLTSFISMAGLYTWILLLCLVQLIRKKRFDGIILLVPGIMNVLICVASPLYGSTRYELPLIACIPLIIGWTLMHSRKTN